MDNEPVVEFAMRSRIGRTGSDGERGERRSGNGTAGSYAPEIVLVEKPIKPGDTLNKLAIQYAVNVAEIKRANNLVSDQDFLALTKIKIPLSRLRLAMASSTSEDDEDVLDSTERTQLIDEDSHAREPSVEDILRKTDTNIAQIRDTLPNGHSSGSFHFVDARPPDSGYSLFFVLAAVFLIFIVVPLILTLIEEEEAVQTTHTN